MSEFSEKHGNSPCQDVAEPCSVPGCNLGFSVAFDQRRLFTPGMRETHMSSRRPPPLNAWRASDAAGRQLFVTRATRGLISRQTKKPEERPGTRHVDRRCPVVCSSRNTGGMISEDCPALPSPRRNEQFEPVHPAGERRESRTPGPVRVTAVLVTNASLEEHGNSPWYQRSGTMPCSGFQPEVCRRHMTSDD